MTMNRYRHWPKIKHMETFDNVNSCPACCKENIFPTLKIIEKRSVTSVCVSAVSMTSLQWRLLTGKVGAKLSTTGFYIWFCYKVPIGICRIFDYWQLYNIYRQCYKFCFLLFHMFCLYKNQEHNLSGNQCALCFVKYCTMVTVKGVISVFKHHVIETYQHCYEAPRILIMGI